MFKKIIFSLLILGSAAMILWSGDYIYKKQSKAINFNSFSVSDSASIVFVPNSNTLLKQNLTALNSFNLPPDLITGIHKLSTISNYDFNKNISTEAYLTFTPDVFSIVFKNENLTVQKLISELLKQLNISAVDTGDQLAINDNSYYHKLINDFIIISNQPIKINTSKPTIKNKGNYHYFYQPSLNSDKTFFKLNGTAVLSFQTIEHDSIKGKAVSPFNYFNIIPTDFDTLQFYGSTRFDADYINLMDLQQSSDFFKWVNNDLIVLKKDNMELIIGYQNGLQNLKNILDEQTLELSEDSLLPTPLFKNNMEISFFKSKYIWQDIVPNSQSEFNLYSELNEFNIIANSMDAMNWFIKSNQLGDVYSNKNPQSKIPLKVNRLRIAQTDSSVNIQIDNRINSSSIFMTQIKSNKSNALNEKSLLLAQNFLVKDSKSTMSSYYNNDTLNILIYDEKSIDNYDLNGNITWSKTLNSPLVQQPVSIHILNETYLVLFMQNQIDIINAHGISKKGFPYPYNGESKYGLVVKYDEQSDYRILIQINSNIINLNSEGTPVEGWRFKKLTSNLKTPIYYQNKNKKDYFYFKDNNDTLHVINRKGESIFNQHFQFKLNNESPFLTGDLLINTLKKVSYENGYIKSKFVLDGHTDSIKTQESYSPTHVNWKLINNKLNLVIEEYNRVIYLNEYGFIEQEIQKPQPNLTYLTHVNNNDKHHVFGNIKNNKLYLLNNFGNQLNSQPIEGNSNFLLTDDYFIVYFNSQIWLYKLN